MPPAARGSPQRRDGVVERKSFVQTMRKDGKAALKNPEQSETFRPHCAQPKVEDRHLEEIEGARHERRPSAIAKKGGKRQITEIEWADGYEQPDEWSEDALGQSSGSRSPSRARSQDRRTRTSTTSRRGARSCWS